MAETPVHPSDPRSNVAKYGDYDPDLYELVQTSTTVKTDESLTPNCPPRLTQGTVGLYLKPMTMDLVEKSPRPTIDELPDAVIDRMVKKDKAFWVDKPGANAYALHDAFTTYGLKTEKVLPVHQDVFPRSYQYDLDCVHYRRTHACDGWDVPTNQRKKPLAIYCRDCKKWKAPGLTPFQKAWATDPGQKRWRVYPDVSAKMSPEEIKKEMTDVGRPFRSEACNWYYKNYPSVKYDVILRKFS